jgi:uncharacterized protein (TIGR03663 family)
MKETASGNIASSLESKIGVYLPFLLIAIAFALRFYNLDLRPFHHDESVHAHFSYLLFKQGTYRYEPMWHGPFLYYVTAVLYRVFGDSEWMSRMMPALFGVALVALPFTLKKQLGFKASLITAFLLAISPAFLYYSRFFRNDIYLVFFSLAAVVCVIQYREKKKSGFIYLASFLFALALCTKENAYITAFSFFSFAAAYFLYTHRQHTRKDLMRIFKDNWLMCIVSVSIIVILYTSLYSFFFGNTPDCIARHSEHLPLINAIVTWSPHLSTCISYIACPVVEAVSHWSSYNTGPTGPFFFYAALSLLYELPLVIFGTAGMVYFARKKDTLMVFMSYWAMSSFFIYSFVVYEKAPWILLHMLLPLAFIAGAFTAELLKSLEREKVLYNYLFSAFTLLVFFFCIFASVNLNYYHFDDPAEPMIQAAQPPASFNDLMATIEEVAPQYEGNQTNIQVLDGIAKTQYLWHLRHYRSVDWSPEELDAPIILVSGDKMASAQNLSGYLQLNSSVMRWHWYPVTDFLAHESPLDYVLFRKIEREPAKTEVALFYRTR